MSSKKNVENVLIGNVDTNSDKKEAKPNKLDISDQSNTKKFTSGMYQVCAVNYVQ